MSRAAQMFASDEQPALKRLRHALYSRPARLFASACARAAVLAGLLGLAACGVGGFSLQKAAIDRSVVTGAIGTDPAADATAPALDPAADGLASDQATIRNAVSSADLEALAGRPLSWANSETGSRGTVTGLVQSRPGGRGRPCRAFEVSRERFDGVAMFRGRACMSETGDWRLDNFTAL